MKKVISIIMAVALFAAFMIPTAFADGMYASVNSATAKTGDTVTLSVGINGNTVGFVSGKVVLSYDKAALELVGMDLVSFAGVANAAAGMANHASTAPVVGDVTACTATFKVLATEPGSYAVNASVSGMRDNEGNVLSVAGATGYITIEAPETVPTEAPTVPETEAPTVPETEAPTVPTTEETEPTTEETVPPTVPGGEDDEPKTGDITPHIMLAVASVIALGAASMFVFKRKAAK